MKSQKNRRGRIKSRQMPTPTSKLTSGRNAVFSTTELLEAILCQLDRRTLLVSAQRVCTFWRTVILQSVRLQQRLYFRPQQEPREGVNGEAQARKQNPLLRAAFLPLFFDRYELSIKDYKELREMSIADMKGNRKKHLAFVRKGASWRRMLVSQPPPRRIGYVFAPRVPRPLSVAEYQSCQFELPEGLRMGELYDIMHKIIWGDGLRQGDHHGSICWDTKSAFASWPNNNPIPLQWRSGLDLMIRDWWGPQVKFISGISAPLPRKKVVDAVWMFRSEDFQEWEMDLRSGFTSRGG